jgi:protein O-GlcNAc transferase
VHLSAKAVADVFLDTPSFNGHSTVGEALHAGLPVVTEPREKMAARVAASILVAGGLSLMIARDPSDYLALATRILTNSPARADCRRRTAHAQATVFDTEGWSGRWERLLLLLYDAASASSHHAQQTKRSHVIQL